MIPLRLTVRNFLCYRDNTPPLDLEGVKVACLCGDNGHGKSALLDAITWALWGCARGRRYGKGDSSQDELIYQGRDEMEVDLEFEARDARYRVIRKHAMGRRPRSGQTLLDLQAADGQGFRSIAGNSVAETEEKVQGLLGMDYDTFVNSAFLLQGQADRFTRTGPTQRKRVLGDIMGLGLYDRLAERARQQAKECERQLLPAQQQLEMLATELSAMPQWQQQLQEAQGGLAQLLPQLEETQAALEQARLRYSFLSSQKDELVRLQQEVERSRRALDELEQRLRSAQRQERTWQETLMRAEEIDLHLKEYQQAREESLRLDSSQDMYQRLSQECQRAQSAIATERVRMEGEIQTVEQAHQRAQLLASRMPELVKEMEQTAGELDVLRVGEKLLHQRQATLQEVALSTGRLQQESQSATQALEVLQQDAVKLRSTPAHRRSLLVTFILFLLHLVLKGLRQNAYCPRCSASSLAEQHARREREITARLLETSEQKERVSKRLDEALASKESLTLEVHDLTAQAQRTPELLRRHERLQGELERASQASREIEGLGLRLTSLRTDLEGGSFAQEEARRLALAQKELARLGYDPKHHQGLRRRLEELRTAPEEGRSLQEARAGLPKHLNERERLEHLAREEQEHLKELQDKSAQLQEELKELPQLEVRGKQLAREVEMLRGRKEELQKLEVRCQEHLRDLEDKARQVEQLTATVQALRLEHETLDSLAEAFGRNGIQAMIIESAIPELEVEANQLLARMTDNLMSLKLETQRERRSGKGEPIETLEIKIADDQGTRGYELFSGGERFRIDFALRIALSKLLAHRSGAPLPTLFIDEGFGSQDVTGRERLVEAIRSIQDDFRLIIVITHIEEMKEAFPVRIEVTKGREGAQFSFSYS